MLEWHGHPIPVADELKLLGAILGRSWIGSWPGRAEACTNKAKQPAVTTASCARARRGHGPRVVQQVCKGGWAHHAERGGFVAGALAAWSAASGGSDHDRLLPDTSTSAALALAGLLPAELAAAKVLVYSNILLCAPVQEIGDHSHSVQTVAAPVYVRQLYCCRQRSG